jgi:hypothetical protein
MLLPMLLLAAIPPTISDEAKVPPYTLPDPLVCADGRKVTDAKMWNEVRRPEVFRLVEENMFGRTPDTRKLQADAVVEIREQGKDALGGKATRTQFKVWPIGKKGPSFDMLLYVPNAAKRPVPVFVGLSFGGNYTTIEDPAVFLPSTWVSKQWALNDGSNHADPKLRGSQSRRWEIGYLIDRGYAVATAYYGDFEADFPEGWKEGFRAAISPAGVNTQWKDGEWAAIGCWAWGMSRMLDVLETVPAIDAQRAIAHGHSRLGKAGLWAGAQDQRFAFVISNDSGCGGAALNKRIFGETVGVISGYYKGRGFPHWFTARFATFSEREEFMPLDAHYLLALVAPRPLYVASAKEDSWADPVGEFLGAVHADPVYHVMGLPGLGTKEYPPLSKSVGTTVGYHVRPGVHDILLEDWKNYADFADRVLARK